MGLPGYAVRSLSLRALRKSVWLRMMSSRCGLEVACEDAPLVTSLRLDWILSRPGGRGLITTEFIMRRPVSAPIGLSSDTVAT